MSTRILNKKDVVAKTSLSIVTIWRLERRGKFPSRIQLCTNRVGWREADVDEWLASRGLGIVAPNKTAKGLE